MQPQVNNENDVDINEADNVNKLGRYAFAYGMVMLSVLAGMLATSVIIGLPIYGTFGCVTLLRYMFRLVALAAAGLAAYAFCCYRYSNGITKLRSSIQIGSLATVFATLGMGTGGATTLILHVLDALGAGYSGLAIPVPLL